MDIEAQARFLTAKLDDLREHLDSPKTRAMVNGIGAPRDAKSGCDIPVDGAVALRDLTAAIARVEGLLARLKSANWVGRRGEYMTDLAARSTARQLGMDYEAYVQQVELGLKYCRGCKDWKPVSAFPRHARAVDGRAWRCRECLSELNRKAYRSRRKKAKARG
jgi:hypothetical protein